jgi:hypothetical protein
MRQYGLQLTVQFNTDEDGEWLTVTDSRGRRYFVTNPPERGQRYWCISDTHEGEAHTWVESLWQALQVIAAGREGYVQ